MTELNEKEKREISDMMARAEFEEFGKSIGCSFDALPDAMKWAHNDKMLAGLEALLKQYKITRIEGGN